MTFATFPFVMSAQMLPEYNMADTTLTDCQGILYDNGGVNGLYGNNLNIATVIHTGGPITITFQGVFNVEPGVDFLMIYDGALPGGTLLGTFTGTNLPGSVVAASGMATLVFTSDNSAVYAGFMLNWETEVPLPVPPEIAVEDISICDATEVFVSFTSPLECSWLDVAIYTVTLNGDEIPFSHVVTNCADNQTQQISVFLDEPLSWNCTYGVQIDVEIPDICGTFHPFMLTDEFEVSGCPIDGQIMATESVICPGSCTEIEFISEACSSLQLNWSHGLPQVLGPHTVCPSATTVYSVEVLEEETGNVQTFEITIEVSSSQILNDDFEICQSEDFFLLESGAEGIWSGPGIMDELTGLFEPDSAFSGWNEVFFESAGCLDSVQIYVHPISTDNVVAACPGSDPFSLNAEPAGGVWNGPNTTPEGVFNPDQTGQYVAYYTLAQCTDSVLIHVDVIGGTFTFDTLCQSVWHDTLFFSPPGGYWTGQVIVDSLLGVFSPEFSPAGDAVFTYVINGCQQDFTGYIKEIYAGDRFHTACPLEEPQVFYENPPQPAGGIWTGDGIIDTATGMFDPSLIPDGNYAELLYTVDNGCSDTMYVYVRQTAIGVESIDFCLGDDPFVLNEESVQNDPSWGGEWYGEGIFFSGEDWRYSPQVSGTGPFYIYYERNTCVDSIRITVFPDGVSPDAEVFCSVDDPVVFGEGITEGGIWTGSGITNALTGVFDPATADAGTYPLYWNAPAGCRDSVVVTVEDVDLIEIQNVPEYYCYLDSNYQITFIPENGIVSGATDTDVINPGVLGEGEYEVIYVYDGIACYGSDTARFVVYPPITAILGASDLTLCEGDAAVLTTEASGGQPTFPLTYTWSNGAFPVHTQVVSPTVTTTIDVTVSDGCSEPNVQSVTLEVFPPIEYEVLISDTLCFGEMSGAEIVYLQPGNYSTLWNGVGGESASAPAGSALTLEMTNEDTGCSVETNVYVPAYPPAVANFSVNPNVGCISFEERENIQFIDLSQHATSGTWYLGDVTVDYVPGSAPVFAAVGAGQTVITLVVTNTGGCSDTTSVSVCVLPQDPVFIPDIFSPNGDGNNDIFLVRGVGIESVEMNVFSRYGQRVFRSVDKDRGWDGRTVGALAPSGNYLYSIIVRLNDGSVQELKGEVTLVR